MKKFLSSLLALTMILSLVIVPANASGNTIGGVSIAPKSVSLKAGEETEITVNTNGIEMLNTGEKLTVDGNEVTLIEAPTITVGNFESNNNSVVTVTADSSGKSGVATAKAVAKGEAIISCTVTCNYKYNDGIKDVTATATQTLTTKVTVTDLQSDFEAAVKQGTVTFKGRTYSAKSGTATFDIDLFNDETLPNTGDDMPTISVNAPFKSTVLVNESGSWYAKYTSGSTILSCAVTLNAEKVSPTVSIKTNLPTNTNAISGQEVNLTADYSRKIGGKSITYTWSASNNAEISGDGASATWKPTKAGTKQEVTVIVKEGKSVAARYVATYDVDANAYQPKAVDNKTSYTLTSAKSITIKAPYLVDTDNNNEPVTDSSVKVTWDKHSSRDIDISPSGNDVVVTGKRTNNDGVKLTATLTYKTLTWKVDYTVYVSALDGELNKVVNGDSLNFDLGDLKKLAEKAVYKVDKTDVTIDSVRIVSLPNSVDGVLYDNSRLTSKVSVPYTVKSNDELYFDAAKGFLGTASLTIEATDTRNNTYNITVNIPVVGDETIKGTVTGTTSGKDVTFTNSDYDFLYYTTTKVSNFEGHFDGTSERGYTLVKEDKDVTITASQFDKNGKVTLYVVGVNSKGIASTGTIEVSQKSYDITYSVVAGKSVTFSQKDFEAFMKDYAQDNGDWTTSSRKDYPYVDFDHVELNSIPNSKNEGTLYYKNSEVTSSSNRKAEYTDMDKMTFEAVSKPSKDTVTLRFTVVGKQYSSERDKGSKVSYPVDVVISVVKEDIVYTVGIDDTVNLKASDFVSFLQDAKSFYRKAELDYVKFDVKNASNYLYGGLYRSYTNYSSGKLAESSDKFYYEPSRNQLDLSDVAYHTTRWAEAGKTVYIPFTVYGTKSEEATGTMAITIAQTMNFTDVKSSDFFYEPVRWAVNQGITNGTSATTFSPYKACTRAEIVTFLWRAAGSPEPTRSTNPFTDVNAVTHSAYYKAILWASQKGITSGTSATTFAPNQLCTRSQIVTFLYRYAGKPSSNYANPFKDVSSVNEASYYNAILWAVGKGITTGTSTTTFSPYASCTRGEAVTFLYRYVNGVK